MATNSDPMLWSLYMKILSFQLGLTYKSNHAITHIINFLNYFVFI